MSLSNLSLIIIQIKIQSEICSPWDKLNLK